MLAANLCALLSQAVTAAGTVATAAAPSQGFASVGGLWKQKETLHNVVVLPLRHPTLFRSLGVQASCTVAEDLFFSVSLRNT